MVGKGFAYPNLMRFFEEISAIPRASYHEERIADYLVAFAQARRLPYYRDELHNVLIRLPATTGRETDKAILLQGHVDMVCEKNQGVTHDFFSDPLELEEKDGWLCAKGTTLGADDGVAVAAMLAILDGALPSHPMLQCLFTVSEEVGMDGARSFDYSRIVARYMLNMDSADETGVIVGCMGGVRSCVTLPVERRSEEGTSVWRLTLLGLAGGHSGEDIHRGRANANCLMGRILSELAEKDNSLCLISVCGGAKDNAIPRESEATVSSRSPDLPTWIEQIRKDIQEELYADDRDFTLTVQSAQSDEIPMCRRSSEQVILFMTAVANGVFAVRPEAQNAVEYSRNFGVITTETDAVKMIFSSRSARESQLNQSERELSAFAAQLGGTAEHYNRYPGWNFSEHSVIREAYTDAYERRYGTKPKTEIIHAGLECGIIKAALPDMDLISCGPTVLNLHSPDEKLNLASLERFFAVISDVCERGVEPYLI